MISHLRELLSQVQGADEIVAGFLSCEGIEILNQCIENRLSGLMLTKLDKCVLFEVACCCNSVVANQHGLESFVSRMDLVANLVQILSFDIKCLTLKVFHFIS